MGYVGMGDLASSEFNSTKYPGICKPSTVSALATFKRLQTQLNRCASVKGIATIAIDGDIGPGTMSMFGKLQTSLITYATKEQNLAGAVKVGTVRPASCASLAMVSDVVGDIADDYANSMRAPEKPPSPPATRPPVLVMPDGSEKAPPAGADLLTAWESASTPVKVAMVAALGGIGYYLYKSSKRGR